MRGRWAPIGRRSLFELRHVVPWSIDPITASSSTTDKQDATFRVGF
jgi:hypothetical protein